MEQYDTVIIGSGTAGKTAAGDLAAQGLRVALVEESPRPGGVCALRGCQAKKWFYEACEAVARCRHLRGLGIAAPPQASWRQVLEAKNAFTEKVPEKTVKGLRARDIDYLAGTAAFVDASHLRVGDLVLAPRACIIASGATPTPLPFDGAELLADSSDFLELKELPPRVVFIGGGFISFEFAHFCLRLGAEEVHVVETAARPLAPFDGDLVDRLIEASAEEGLQVHTRSTVSAVTREGAHMTVKLESGAAIAADLVVNGAGRAPHIDHLQLEQAGIASSPRGITVDRTMKTTNPAVYAVGDCVDSIQLARVADMEAQVAVSAILAERGGGRRLAMDYRVVPAVLFTYPQLGMVGKTEEELRQEGTAYRRSSADHLAWTTYKRVGLRHAAYKILADDKGAILGAHFLADSTTGLVNTFKQAMLDGATVDKLHRDNIMSPYPSRESDIPYMLEALLD